MNRPALAVLQEALAALGVTTRACHELSTFGGPSRGRGAFRLETSAGETVKARVLLAEEQAARVAGLAARLEGAAMPRLLARHGRVLLEEWVEGEPVAPDARDAALLEDAARLLADLHGRGLDQGGSAATELAAMGDLARGRLATLRSEGLIDARRTRALEQALALVPPQPGAIGVIHGDFCAENCVRAADGRLVVVDNESLNTGLLDYDLGMTWYRWPLCEADADTFERAYASHGGRRPAARAFHRAAAVLKGLWVRSRHDLASLPIGLARLDELRVP